MGKIFINLDKAKVLKAQAIIQESERYLEQLRKDFIDSLIQDDKPAQSQIKGRFAALKSPEIFQAIQAVDDIRDLKMLDSPALVSERALKKV